MSVCTQLTASQAIVFNIIGCCHFHRKCWNHIAAMAGGELFTRDEPS